MIKAIQFLSSSSGCFSFSYRLKKPHSNCFVSLLSRKSSATISALIPSEKYVFALQFRKGYSSGALKTSRVYCDSNPSRVSSASTENQSVGGARKINFCESCGGPTKHEIPDGEEKMRAICTLCGKISYQNPKLVVGCLIEHENKVLLCKRKIHPSYGLWTLPAGYMEIGESAAEGAARETMEEANADVEILSPFAMLDIPLIGQTYIIFLAKLKRPHFSPGPESLECKLFSLDDIPFDFLAFSSMVVTLKMYAEDRKIDRLKFHYGTISKRIGTSPSEIHAYTFDDHSQSSLLETILQPPLKCN